MSEQEPEQQREHGDGPIRRLAASPPAPRFSFGRDIESDRERTRRHVALILVFVLAVIALSLVALTAWGKLTIDETKDLAATVLSPVVAVTGTALGFYFGAGRERN